MTTTNTNLAKRCTSTPFGAHTVSSHTDNKKSYTVIIDENGHNTCTCIAFAMKRNKLGGYSAIGTPECTCKHINAFLAARAGCGWNSLTGEAQQVETICPRCYEYVEEYDTRDPDDVDLDELMADFLAIQKKLKGAK